MARGLAGHANLAVAPDDAPRLGAGDVVLPDVHAVAVEPHARSGRSFMMKATPRCWQIGRSVSATRAMASLSTPFSRAGRPRVAAVEAARNSPANNDPSRCARARSGTADRLAPRLRCEHLVRDQSAGAPKASRLCAARNTGRQWGVSAELTAVRARQMAWGGKTSGNIGGSLQLSIRPFRRMDAAAALEQEDDEATRQDRDRGRESRSPQDVPTRGWREILLRTKNEFRTTTSGLSRPGWLLRAAAVFPAVAAVVSIYGMIADPAQVQQQLEALLM